MNFAFKILMLTMNNEPGLLCQAFLSGADGYLLKDDVATDLLPALHVLLEAKIYVSPLMSKELPDICQLKKLPDNGLSLPP